MSATVSDAQRRVSVSRVINVSPAAVFDVLASPAGHAAIDGSGQVTAPRPGQPDRLALGTKSGSEWAEERGLFAKRPSKHSLLVAARNEPQRNLEPVRRSRICARCKFCMNMKQGLPYRITNTVVEFEENRRIAWRHFGGHVWRYELEPVPSGTKVTETFDWSTSRTKRFIELMRYPAKHVPHMERTLERLDHHLTSPRRS